MYKFLLFIYCLRRGTVEKSRNTAAMVRVLYLKRTVVACGKNFTNISSQAKVFRMFACFCIVRTDRVFQRVLRKSSAVVRYGKGKTAAGLPYRNSDAGTGVTYGVRKQILKNLRSNFRIENHFLCMSEETSEPTII